MLSDHGGESSGQENGKLHGSSCYKRGLRNPNQIFDILESRKYGE